MSKSQVLINRHEIGARNYRLSFLRLVIAGCDISVSIDRLNFHVGDGQFYNMGAVGKDIDILVSIEAVKNK